MELGKKAILITVIVVLITGTLYAGFLGEQTIIHAATLFSDNFEDGDAIGWTTVTGSWSVVTDGTKWFKQASTTGEALVYAGSSSWTDYTVEAKVKLLSTGSASASGIIGRYADNSNYYLFRLHSGDGKVQLYKKAGGSFTLLQEAAMTININTVYTLKLALNGNNLTGYVDGVQKVAATSTGINSGRIGARGFNQSFSIDEVIISDGSAIPTPTPTPVPADVIIDNGAAGYSETGTWADSSLTGYNGSSTRYSQSAGSTAKWEAYAPETGNYNVYVWYPYHTNSTTGCEYKTTTMDGTWIKNVNQQQNADQWYKIATVSAVVDTGFSVTLTAGASGTTRADAVKYEKTTAAPDPIPTPTPVPGGSQIYLNQSGFDLNKPKRFTLPNVVNGTPFYVKKGAATVYSGTTSGGIGDFSSFNPVSDPGEYYIECDGKTSVNFSIGPYWMQRVSIDPALRFMIESRSDIFNTGGGLPYAWRDSSQFSFELNSLVLQYMANPSVYERMPYAVTHLTDSEYSFLRTQDEPDIIWLLQFAVERYYDLRKNHGKTLHELVKEQLAYFLYIYPEINQWVSQSYYEKIRQLAMDEWAVAGSNYCDYEVSGHDNNLFATKTVIGNGKGSYPPGHSIIPNLMMYEVLKRDGLPGYQSYFDAAYNNCQWIINNLDWTDPVTTKGQRMSEHITMEALAYFLEMYPSQAPPGLLAKINSWADIMIARSNNLWDFRKYDDPADGSGAGNIWVIPSYNEPGNVAGFMAPAYAARRVLADETKQDRLQQIAIAQMDNVFGRNPFGRHFCYDKQVFEGVESGWFSEYQGGYGALNNTPAVLDGSPKDSAYPYNPGAAPGYTEGWVAFNTAWNSSLAYDAADEIEVKVYNSGFGSEISSASRGSAIGIQLKAPLNVNYSAAETGTVVIQDASGNKYKITVTEKSNNDFYFRTTYTIPATAGSWIDISYGYGIFKQTKRITLN